MTHRSSNSSDCSGPDNIDDTASAEQVAKERKRLATLIGRMLARHWLHQQPAAGDAGAQSHKALGDREKHQKRR